MTPFQQFRVWFGRASNGQRGLTSVAAVLVLAAMGWLVVPADVAGDGSGSFALDQTASEPGSLQNAPEGAGAAVGPLGSVAGADAELGTAVPGSGNAEAGDAGVAGGTGVGGGAVPPAGSDATRAGGSAGKTTSATTTTGKRCPAGTDQGATERDFRVAITIINIGGGPGNATINVPSPELQEKYWRLVINSMNAAGGFGCRKLIPEFHSVNPVNANEAQQKCLEIANSKPFLAIDPGPLGAVGASDCIPQSKTPMIAYLLSNAQLMKYYPYYISPNGIVDDTIRNGILGAKQRGYFTKGFKKVGLVYRSCISDHLRIMRAALREAGIPAASTVEYSLGCAPGSQSSPADYQQAVLTFKNKGVTHVTTVGVGDFANFTRPAGQQGFRPQYVIVENLLVATVGNGGTLQPDPENLHGAVGVIPGRYGEDDTPGLKPTGATARCNAMFSQKGEPAVYQQQVGFGGQICSLLFVTERLLAVAPKMRRDTLVRGLRSLGTMDLSFPHGPVDFAATPQGAPYGRTFWRTTQYAKECRCFRVIDASFRPAFR